MIFHSMENFLPWFILRSVPGVGNRLFKLLLDHFKTPERILDSSVDELIALGGINKTLASAILNHGVSEQVKQDYAIVREKGYSIVTLTDPDYPYLLLQIYDPPPFLYVYGTLGSSRKNISVVGSRAATSYGMVATRRLCADLASHGITVVSGASSQEPKEIVLAYLNGELITGGNLCDGPIFRQGGHTDCAQHE